MSTLSIVGAFIAGWFFHYLVLYIMRRYWAGRSYFLHRVLEDTPDDATRRRTTIQ